jgi:hypothetical protein
MRYSGRGMRYSGIGMRYSGIGMRYSGTEMNGIEYSRTGKKRMECDGMQSLETTENNV